MRQVIALTALLAVGCGTAEEWAPGPETAFLGRLWVEVFAGDGWHPAILWVEGDDLDPECDGKGWARGDDCVDGQLLLADLAAVAIWPGARLDETALAHEFAHARLFQQTGDADPAHLSDAFQPGGSVQRGEAWLRTEHDAGNVPAALLR